MDHLISNVTQQLRQMGALDRTLLVVTADHGEAFGEDSLYFTHEASLSEAVVRVPLMLRLPGTIRPGVRVSQVVRTGDIAPTILAALGIPIPAVMDGTDLMPALDGDSLELEAYAESRRFQQRLSKLGLSHYPLEVPGIEGKLAMLRAGALKLVRHPRKGGVDYRLYDLSSDPSEELDLSEARPEDLSVMKRRMEDWKRRDTKPESVTAPVR